MKRCFLDGHGACEGKISGEHYISRTVLDAIGGGGAVQVGGLPWQPPDTIESFGINSLVSKVLCEKHNAGLSTLDKAAGKLFRAIDGVDKRPAAIRSLTQVDGNLIERWLLKLHCGLAAAKSKGMTIPDNLLRLLTGEPWPAEWGLYVPFPAGPLTLATEFYFEALNASVTGEIKGIRLRVAGVHLNLLLGRPDHPASWGLYRPRGLIFNNGSLERRIEFGWPTENDQAVVYTRTGQSSDRPPQWAGWKETTS
jgi:hypothetical protein